MRRRRQLWGRPFAVGVTSDVSATPPPAVFRAIRAVCRRRYRMNDRWPRHSPTRQQVAGSVDRGSPGRDNDNMDDTKELLCAVEMWLVKSFGCIEWERKLLWPPWVPDIAGAGTPEDSAQKQHTTSIATKSAPYTPHTHVTSRHQHWHSSQTHHTTSIPTNSAPYTRTVFVSCGCVLQIMRLASHASWQQRCKNIFL